MGPFAGMDATSRFRTKRSPFETSRGIVTGFNSYARWFPCRQIERAAQGAPCWKDDLETRREPT
jgi:hypothetical protein